MAFGQHQSFYLREKWISKGIKELGIYSDFFNDKENFEKIGLGKNMVESLKFWLGATKIIEEINKEVKVSKLGQLIYKYDKFIKFNFTKLLLHYNLATGSDYNNRYSSTVIYWLFNECNETVFEKGTLLENFKRWVDRFVKREVSIKSLDRDISMALQLYTMQNVIDDPEEVAVSPLSNLKLIKKDDKRYVKSEIDESELPSEIIMVHLIHYYNRMKINYISIDELLKDKLSIGKILNLSRSTLILKLDELSKERNSKYRINFIRTNNLDTISFKPDLDITEYIEYIYDRMTLK